MDVQGVGRVDQVVVEYAMDVGLANEAARVAGVDLLHQGHGPVVLGDVDPVYVVGRSPNPFGCRWAWEFDVFDRLFGLGFWLAAVDRATRSGERRVACGQRQTHVYEGGRIIFQNF